MPHGGRIGGLLTESAPRPFSASLATPSDAWSAYFLPSAMCPRIHAHARLPVTQTAKGTRGQSRARRCRPGTHLPARGGPW